ncbi:hypothetical protein HMPREF9069_00880 [Atopobium sp. oral taxon 810 str. F0209]|nr:hypothetical protein HMPREF9069_00880 [Atopobium sp. oral taxon 810 str. F0209]
MYLLAFWNDSLQPEVATLFLYHYLPAQTCKYAGSCSPLQPQVATELNKTKSHIQGIRSIQYEEAELGNMQRIWKLG